MGARVNGRIVPLRTKLANGDIVEILTQTGHKPSRDWLNFVHTSRARNKIQHFIHAEEKTRSVELGRRLFEKEVRRFGVEKGRADDEALLTVAGEYGAQKADDLFAAIGYGKVTARAVLGRLVGPGPAEGEGAGRRAGVGRQAHARHRRREDQGPRPRRPDGVPRALLQPDPRREDRGLHHARQGRVRPLGRCVPTSSTCCTTPSAASTWSGTRRSTRRPYTVRLRISVEDRRGILADVSSRIADINTNIRDVEATVDEAQRGSIRMTVEIIGREAPRQGDALAEERRRGAGGGADEELTTDNSQLTSDLRVVSCEL